MKSRSSILDEASYYPFGLTMAGISSKAADGLENKRKYNGIEFENDFDLNTYDAFFRELDPQTGRWWQIDPKIEDMEQWSPYASNYDNPITYSDPLGDDPDGDDPPTAGSMTWSFVKGVGQSLWGTVEGVGCAIAHPIETAKGLGTVIAHPIETAKAIGNAVSETYTEFKNGNGDVKANIFGKVVGEIGQAIIGAGEVKAAIKGIEGAKAAQGASALSKASKFESIEQSAAKISKELNGGKARVQLRSQNEMKRIDLMGDAHLDKKTYTNYNTPHTATSQRNLKAPNQPAYNTSDKLIKYSNTTVQELRTVRRYLKNNQ